MSPTVSILICSYNAERFIAETIGSVLNQVYDSLELLILDNNSQDKTVEVIKEMREKDKRINLYESDENLGSYPGLNYLLERAKGTYIAINDHDDIWHPEKLEKQVDFLEKNSQYVGCGTAIINWYEQYGKTIYRTQPKESNVAWHTSLVFRNQGYRYDTEVRIGTDFHFMKNILCKSANLIHNFPEPMVFRRIFKGSHNLSGQWMKKAPLQEITRLNIGLVDKLALINRRIFPQENIESLLVTFMGNNTPVEYIAYTRSFMNSTLKRS